MSAESEPRSTDPHLSELARVVMIVHRPGKRLETLVNDVLTSDVDSVRQALEAVRI